MKRSLPLEEKSKIETQTHYAKWKRGAYQFLLCRTMTCYDRKKTSERRRAVEKTTELLLPPISDSLLIELYKAALQQHQATCRREYLHTGYQMTASETLFLKTLEEVLKALPSLKDRIEVYPSRNYSKELRGGMKMAIGDHVPDFLIFGLKKKGASAVAFEIDGDSHTYKYAKDLQKDLNLESLGIFSLSIPNEKAGDAEFIKRVLLALCPKMTESVRDQIQSSKRRIWTKTIACQLSLEAIERLALERGGISLHLIREARELTKLKSCPRQIRSELDGLL